MNTSFELSICIAAYNRGYELYEKITNILAYSGDDVQIVVADNASTDNTVELLRQIQDKRVKLITNTQNKGPTFNYIRALREGDGRYLMFMTDKDTLKPEYLEALIHYLNQYEIGTGYCQLNYTGQNKAEVFKAGFEALDEVAYLSKHPTGYLYKRNLLQEINKMEWYENKQNVDSFPFEFLCAQLACKHKAGIIYLPLLETKKLEKNQEKSLTYSERNNNIFFSPENRYSFMLKCLEHMETLEISALQREELTKKVYCRYWLLAVNVYPNYLNDINLCEHYRIQHRRMPFNERLEVAYTFLKNFSDYREGRARSITWYRVWTMKKIFCMRLKNYVKIIMKK